MHSFYLPEKVTGETTVITDAAQLHHLRDVLRLKVRDKVVIFDNEGNKYSCTIAELDRKQALLNIDERQPAPMRNLKLAVACAIPKHSRMDDIIDKLTQMDVDVIIPLMTERVVVRVDDSRESRLERWKKIALSASEQSQRRTLPVIFPVTDFKDALAESKDYQLKLVPNLLGERRPIRQATEVPRLPAFSF